MKTSNLCPGCGQPNLCAISLGKPPEQCWCMSSKHSSKSEAVKLPLPKQPATCYCQSCLEKIKTAHTKKAHIV
ncbi:cysteine-rich CWC family protein [Endozoicomonas montiporae]|uniref:cysteine-rich CWC family protein n=1 Tax=Endozoicomonas montiporae TaxID=1027273 RepID=UPI0009E42125|nr:cysteine-rich CWC family protein [Endozoicomonas montiporae]